MSGNGATRLKVLCEELETLTFENESVLSEFGRLSVMDMQHDLADDAKQAEALRILHEMGPALGGLYEGLRLDGAPRATLDRVADIQAAQQRAMGAVLDAVTIDYAAVDGSAVQRLVMERLEHIQRVKHEARELRHRIDEASGRGAA